MAKQEYIPQVPYGTKDILPQAGHDHADRPGGGHADEG